MYQGSPYQGNENEFINYSVPTNYMICSSSQVVGIYVLSAHLRVLVGRGQGAAGPSAVIDRGVENPSARIDWGVAGLSAAIGWGVVDLSAVSGLVLSESIDCVPCCLQQH